MLFSVALLVAKKPGENLFYVLFVIVKFQKCKTQSNIIPNEYNSILFPIILTMEYLVRVYLQALWQQEYTRFTFLQPCQYCQWRCVCVCTALSCNKKEGFVNVVNFESLFIFLQLDYIVRAYNTWKGDNCHKKGENDIQIKLYFHRSFLLNWWCAFIVYCCCWEQALFFQLLL